MAEILKDGRKDNATVETYLNIARIWRLEPGENVLQIERDYENEIRDNLPIPLEGRVLRDDEIIENINVTDTDVLLYEVQAHSFLKNNNSFAFIPK